MLGKGGCCYRPPTGVSQGKTLPQAPKNKSYILSVRVSPEEMLPNVGEEWRRGQIIVQKEEVREGLRAAGVEMNGTLRGGVRIHREGRESSELE